MTPLYQAFAQWVRQPPAAANAHRLAEAANRLQGAAARIGATNVAALCHRAETSSTAAPRDGELLEPTTPGTRFGVISQRSSSSTG
ncbi:MAG: Hpt domain-containing protein [Propionibacteriales bacterium]|nr:Hpt domain-containing protein [Propionibacteriales bacterium]